MNNFDAAFEYTIGNEGGYTNNRNDSGNWTGGRIGSGTLKGTKYGISAASYPTLDIANLTLDQAKDIYRRDYWTKFKLDQIVNDNVAIKCFDMIVNMGGNAVFLIQLSVKATFPIITVDGIIGVQTISFINSANPDGLLECLEVASGTYYWCLANKVNSRFKMYLTGWFNRAYRTITGIINAGK